MTTNTTLTTTTTTTTTMNNNSISNNDEQDKCNEKRQNAEIKVNLFQKLYDDTTDQQRERIRNGSIHCAKFLRVFFLISQSTEEFQRMLAKNNDDGDVATVVKQQQQQQQQQKLFPWKSKRMSTVLIIALIALISGTIVMFSCCSSIQLDASARTSVAWRRQQQKFYNSLIDHLPAYFWNYTAASSRENTRRVVQKCSRVDFAIRYNVSNHTGGIVVTVVKQELFTMDLTSNNISSSFISQAVAASSASGDTEQQDGPILVMEDTPCANYDIQNKTCIVAILGDHKVELSNVEEQKALALLAANIQDGRAATGGMVSMDWTWNEMEVNHLVSPRVHSSNALVKYHTLSEKGEDKVKGTRLVSSHLNQTVIDSSPSHDMHQNHAGTDVTIMAAVTTNGTNFDVFTATFDGARVEFDPTYDKNIRETEVDSSSNYCDTDQNHADIFKKREERSTPPATDEDTPTAPDIKERKNDFFNAAAMGDTIAADWTQNNICESEATEELVEHKSAEPQAGITEADENAEGLMKREKRPTKGKSLVGGTHYSAVAEPKDPEKDQSVRVLILCVLAQRRLSAMLCCFCSFTLAAIFLFCGSVANPRYNNLEGDSVLMDSDADLASMEGATSADEDAGEVDAATGESTIFAIVEEPMPSVAPGTSFVVTGALTSFPITGKPTLSTIARETTPSTVVLEPTLHQALAPMLSMAGVDASSASDGEQMDSNVIGELSTVAREPSEEVSSTETAGDPTPSTVMEEAVPCDADPSVPLGTIFVDGLRRSARLRGKRAVNYRC